MNKEDEKFMSDLQRHINAQNFETKEELEKFLDSLIGQDIPTMSKDKLTLKEQAQDLVFEAYELTPQNGRKKIEIALALDINCIEAYEYLGIIEQNAIIANVFFERGVSIGRKIFGGDFLEKNKGHFWGIHETRPFMRCMQQYAECQYTMDNKKESVAIYEEMIELNPNDNQGVRDQLLLYLIELNEDKKFKKYAKAYEDDFMAFPLFNRALFAFKTEGETKNSNKLLEKALAQNKHVAKRLLLKKQIGEIAEYYGIGDENEANYYASYAQEVWASIEGALDWLKKHNKDK
ncbi:MAG: hypothetical protein ACOXZK_05175 [Bacteroidales bacterium]|jgi:tetratricopeptide (TPR) repeat protein|nr:hypothetical protein [Bacteroidales bacterium]